MIWAYAVYSQSQCLTGECFLVAAYRTRQEAQRCLELENEPSLFIAEIKEGDAIFAEDK